MALRIFKALDEGGISALWEDIVLEVSKGVQQLQQWANSTFVKSVNGKSGSSITLNKSDIGLNKVENTADAEKRVAYAAQAGNTDTLDGKHASDFMSKTEHEEFEIVIADALNDLDGRKIDKTKAVVTVIESTEQSYTYDIKQGGEVVGTISFAGLVQAGLIKSGGVEVNPAGQEPGTYIYLVLNNEEETRIYIKADTLIKQYIGFTGTTITTNVDGTAIKAEVNDGTITSTKLAQAVNTDIAKGVSAHTAINDTSTGLGTKAAANSVGYDLDFDATTSKVFLKNVHGTRIGNGVETSIDSYEDGAGITFTDSEDGKKKVISVSETLRQQVADNASDIDGIQGQIGNHTLGQNVYASSKLTDTTYSFEGAPSVVDGFNVVEGEGSAPMKIDVKVTEVSGHTVESNVPENAVFTDTHDTNESGTGITVSGTRGKVINLSQGTQTTLANADADHTNLGGHKVGKDVPADAVFTDTSTNKLGHYAPVAEDAQRILPDSAGIRDANRDIAFVASLQRDSKGHVTAALDTCAVQAFTDAEIHAIVAAATARIAANGI